MNFGYLAPESNLKSLPNLIFAGFIFEYFGIWAESHFLVKLTCSKLNVQIVNTLGPRSNPREVTHFGDDVVLTA